MEVELLWYNYWNSFLEVNTRGGRSENTPVVLMPTFPSMGDTALHFRDMCKLLDSMEIHSKVFFFSVIYIA